MNKTSMFDPVLPPSPPGRYFRPEDFRVKATATVPQSAQIAPGGVSSGSDLPLVIEEAAYGVNLREGHGEHDHQRGTGPKRDTPKVVL